MPVVGFISADGTTDQPEGQGHCSFEFALALAADGNEEAFPYPYPLLKGIADSIQDRGEYISVTSILHCLRSEFLTRTEPYYVSVESMYPAFRGTLFHGLLEANPNPNGAVEQKTIRTHKGIEIGGTFDSKLIFKDERSKKIVLQDWKTTENLPKYDSPYSSHMAQINLYRWLLGLDPDEVVMEVHYFSMKGHKMCRLKNGGTSKNGRAITNQHWSDEQVERFLDDRLVKLKASFVTRIPMPYDMVPEEDKWQCEYCPVRTLCSRLMVDEREAAWRKAAGLPPAGTASDPSPLWRELFDDYRGRIAASNVATQTEVAPKRRRSK
jgi:hypothetical protein